MNDKDIGYRCKVLELDLQDVERTAQIHKALASKVRLQMLRLLILKGYCVNELADALGIPASTAALNIRILEEAGLIVTEQQPGTRGMAKLCNRLIDTVITGISDPSLLVDSGEQEVTYSLPIGSYSDCQACDYCGMLSDTGTIGRINYPQSFFDPERLKAQLMWFKHGYFEYRVSNLVLKGNRASYLRVSFEACSEVGNYNMDWPSDIYVSVNGRELGVWCCPSDFGDRHGILTPAWWGVGSTQYGRLKTWSVTEKGAALDDKPVGGVTIGQLGLDEGNYFTVRIGVHRDAQHVGGMNLFGHAFGDHPQDLLVQVGYSRGKKET